MKPEETPTCDLSNAQTPRSTKGQGKNNSNLNTPNDRDNVSLGGSLPELHCDDAP
jgi:hypothetical protein